MLRGHVAEQEVFAQLDTWAGKDLVVPEASNHAGSDLSLGGHDFNVKVGADASTIAEHLRTHPDIPVIVNADMDGLPADALHVDLAAPIDPDILAEHSVVVADGMTLSHLHEQMADALGPAMDSFDPSDLLDSAEVIAIPGISTALRVVVSGIREQRLIAHHGSAGRAFSNVASDAALTGGGATTGGLIGLGLDAALDVLTLGATAGLGTTIIGPAIGAFLGARLGSDLATEKRMRPLQEARDAAAAAVTAVDETATQALDETNRGMGRRRGPRG